MVVVFTDEIMDFHHLLRIFSLLFLICINCILSIDLESFLGNWLANKYSSWPVISKAAETHLVIGEHPDYEKEILAVLESKLCPVLTGMFPRELRKKNELFHAITVITVFKKYSSSVVTTLTQIGWRRKDIFLFVAPTNLDLLEFYQGDYVKKLKHRVGYVLETGTVYVDPFLYASGVPIPITTEISRRHPSMGYSLQGRKLRIAGCVDVPPYHFVRSRNPMVEDGSNYRMFQTASKVFNFSLEINAVEGAGYGTLLENGTWTSMLGNLIYSERNFDMAIIFGHLYHFFDKFDFIGTISCSTIRFWQAEPVIQEVSWTSLIDPFNWDIWGLTTLSYVIFSLAMWLVFRYFPVGSSMSPSGQLYQGFLVPYKIAMDQSLPLISDGIRKISVPWFVLTLITGTAYRTVMISFLTFPSYPEVPQTFAELAIREDYKTMLFTTGAVETQFFQENTSPTIQAINKRLIFIGTRNERDCHYGALFHDKAVCISWHPDTEYHFLEAGVVNRNNLEKKPFLTSKDAALFTSVTIPFQKDSIYSDSFAPIMLGFFESGIYWKWMKELTIFFKRNAVKKSKELLSDSEYGKEYEKGLRRIEESDIGGERPLQVENLVVVFLVLCGGLVLSTVCLFKEVEVIKIMKQLRNYLVLSMRSWFRENNDKQSYNSLNPVINVRTVSYH